MIDGREPNYICLDTRSLALVRRLSDSDRLLFFDGLYAAYTDKLNGTSEYVYPDNMVGDLIKQAAVTMDDGFDTYMRKVNANPSGKKTSDNPKGNHRVATDSQSNKDQINKDQNNKDQSNQIMQELIDDGYTDTEISSALKKCDFSSVRNPAAYVRQTIENQRKQLAKSNHVPAQDFQQRDYSDVDNEYKNQLAEEIRMAKLHNPEIFKA